MIEQLINELASTTKKTMKESILSNYDNDFIKEVALYTFDTMNKQYYVKKYNKCNAEGDKDIKESWPDIKELLDNLSNRSLSGNMAINAVEYARSFLTSESQEVFDKVLGRDWKVGASKSTINRVWPGTIPEFAIALAAAYDSTKHQKYLDKHTHFISRKLDGCRCILMNVDGVWSAWSRAGKPFLTLGNVIKDLNTWDVKNVVLDGELCLIDKNGDEDFQSVMKQIKKKNHTIDNPKFKVFDYLELEVFNMKYSKTILSERLGNLAVDLAGLDLPTIDILEQVEFTPESFAELLKESKDSGWEGLMLRRDTIYKGTRSNELLKVKEFFDDEYTILGLDVGDMTFQVPGQGVETFQCVRNVKIKHKGHIVSVGSGLTKDQRIHYYNNQEELIGKLILVKYFEETYNQNGGISLRFPTLGHIYDEERDT
jgi:DNA ligase-1|tara:strand:- start:1887 stop:3170 length:1284 start_codon:yes stop_codon:yes gene_type:complete